MIYGFLIAFVRSLMRQCRIPVALRNQAARDVDPVIDKRRKIVAVASKVCLEVSEYPRDWLRDILDEAGYQLNILPRPQQTALAVLDDMEAHRR